MFPELWESGRPIDLSAFISRPGGGRTYAMHAGQGCRQDTEKPLPTCRGKPRNGKLRVLNHRARDRRRKLRGNVFIFYF